MEDLSQSTFFPPTNAPPQLHDFMPMPPASSRVDEEEDPEKAEFRSELKKKMEEFWEKQLKDVTDATSGGGRLTHPLPLARITKIMKMDQDVKLVSAATTMLFAKACEIFIKELTERAWIHTEKKNRRTLKRDEIARALRDDELFSFLHNTVTMPDQQEATDGDDGDQSPPPPSYEEAANDVVHHHQQVYIPEPYQLHYAADHHPFSYPMMMNTSNMMNRFEEGSSSSSAVNNLPAIDPFIAYGMNMRDISPNFTQIGGEMPPPYHSVAPPPRADVNPASYMNFGQFGEEMNPAAAYMNQGHQLAPPQPPRPNVNAAATFQFQFGEQMLPNPTQPPAGANPDNAAYRDYWRQH